MNVLMIDTAEGTRALLSIDGREYYSENLVNAGAETLMPLIDSLVKGAGANIKDIDVFGACVGPGSFTGLRVGLATVKTMCYALGKKCFAVNNLRLNSYNNSSDKVISIANAGNNVCYLAMFDGEEEDIKTCCVTMEDAKRTVAEHPDYAVSTDVKLGSVFPGAAGVGKNELSRAISVFGGTLIDQKELLPLYVRKAQPERGEGDL